METLASETREVTAPAVPACDTCGATLAPDGTCLEVGACRSADQRAARSSRSGATVKSAVAPAAWNARGYVD